MKKRILIGLGIIGVISLLVFILVPRDQLQEIKIPSSDSKTNKEVKGDMVLISAENTSNYENGYFYINNDSNKIMYFDYNTKKEVYLCNKPNCKHDNNTCSSYLEIAQNNELFYYNDYLYFINAEAAGNVIHVNFDGTRNEENEGRPATIYRMNLDGTDKKKLFTVPSGTQISMPYIIKGNILYSFLETYKINKDGSNTFASSVTERKLVAINLDTGKYEEIMDGLHKSFIGEYEDKIVFQEIEYIKNPDSFGDNTKGYIDNLYHSKTRIKVWDPNTKKEETVYEGLYKNIETLKFYKDGIYFIGQGSKNLEYLNFKTKKQEIIKELSKIDYQISTIADDKILIYSYKDRDAHVKDAYVIDVKTKEMKEFKLKDKNEYLIKILSSNDAYYFVKTETILGKEYTTWAGTKQQSIIGTNYGLIKKSDYWASNSNYIKMTNAK